LWLSVADPDPGSDAFFGPDLDLGSGMEKIQIRDQGSGMNIPENLISVFWVKKHKFFEADPDPGSCQPWIWDPGSGINVPDPHYRCDLQKYCTTVGGLWRTQITMQKYIEKKTDFISVFNDILLTLSYHVFHTGPRLWFWKFNADYTSTNYHEIELNATEIGNI
jgi:hypothetical protein